MFLTFLNWVVYGSVQQLFWCLLPPWLCETFAETTVAETLGVGHGTAVERHCARYENLTYIATGSWDWAVSSILQLVVEEDYTISEVLVYTCSTRIRRALVWNSIELAWNSVELARMRSRSPIELVPSHSSYVAICLHLFFYIRQMRCEGGAWHLESSSGFFSRAFLLERMGACLHFAIIFSSLDELK